MHAIILAAGRGNRLAEFNPDGRPKCLLEFGGRSLLARQLDILFSFGVRQITLVVGYEADQIIDHVGTLSSRPEVAFVYNPAYTEGSVLSLLAAQDALNGNVSVLVLDADVLFHPQILQILIESPNPNCYLIDRDFVPGDEPVKIAINKGKMLEFRIHHIHHLSPRIPNYRLQECLEAHAELQMVTKIGLRDSWALTRLQLWDGEAGRLIGFQELDRRNSGR